MIWKVYKNQGAQDQVDHRSNDDGTRELTVFETWIVENDTNIGTVAVLAAPGLPVVGALYTIDGLEFACRHVTPQRSTKSRHVFEVQVEYLRKTVLPPDTETTIWDVDIAFSGQKFSQCAYKDNDDKAITNSANQPFDPSIERVYFDEKVDISFRTTNPGYGAAIAALRGYVNESPVSFSIKGASRSYDEKSLLLDDGNASSSSRLEDGTPVWDVKISYIGRDDTYTFHVLDQGYCELDDEGKLVEIKDKFGDRLSAPARLDGNGKKLDADADPVYLDFDVLPEGDVGSVIP